MDASTPKKRRLFWTDFNDPRCLSSCEWWEPDLEVGEEVLLTDGEMNVVLGRITEVLEQPDLATRTRGLFLNESLTETWLDGEALCSLALAYMTVQTRAGIPITVNICPRRAGEE